MSFLVRILTNLIAIGTALFMISSTSLVWAAPEPFFGSEAYEQRLVLKFRDAVRARASSSGDITSSAGFDLSSSQAVADRFGAKFLPLIRLSEEALTRLEERARAQSDRAQPDLAGMVIVDLKNQSKPALEAAARAFLELSEVEWASFEALGVPPPFDLPPTSGDLVGQQTYLGDNPGQNANFARGIGATGDGIRISDCEYGWNPDHEDLNEIDLHLEPGQTIHPSVYSNGWEQHGTAVAGVTSSLINAYGCNAIAPACEFYSYPEWTVEEKFRRVTCITNAIANSEIGDVVLLEMQTPGEGGGFGPAELDIAVWTVVKTGTDAGVIVVAAAGNGNQNLDSAPYEEYMSRGDSGAIIIGAGSSTISHNKLSFSTYGSRVDVQAWGQNVMTLGYGDIAFNGLDKNQWYTPQFSGTSSASSISAPCVALIQSFHAAQSGTLLTSVEMRQLLIETGWPQQNEMISGHIGPAINLRNALMTLYPALDAPHASSPGTLRLTSTPQPSRGASTIQFELSEPSAVMLAAFDVAGRHVRTLLNEYCERGPHQVIWNGFDASGMRLGAGLYLLRLEAGGETQVSRIVFVR